jgi:hypothetical protein
MRIAAVIAMVVFGVFGAPPSHSADKIGIFETILESSVAFSETTAAIESAISGSSLVLQGSHVIRVPDDSDQAKLYVLTSPEYAAAAASESPRTISAQILRVAVFTSGDEQKTFVNMANPVAHAMVFYANSGNYDTLILAANAAAEEIRQLVAAVPGNAVSEQTSPLRTEKHYRKYKGDGPARMMAKFRTWKKSQLLIEQDTVGNFEATVNRVATALENGTIADASEPQGWEKIAQIRLRDDVVYFGLTNPYIEDKMIRINSRFRSDGKSELSPFPGVDHVAALPTEVLVVKDGDDTLVLHYGQMWRMQLYFWDSGYRAFTANVGVPANISDSIESALGPPPP